MSEHVLAQPQRANAPQETTKIVGSLQRRDMNQPEPSTLQEWFFDTVSGTFAEPRFGFDFSGVPALTGMVWHNRPLLRTQPMLQRSPKDGTGASSPCPTCPEAEPTEISEPAESAAETAATIETTESMPEPPSPGGELTPTPTKSEAESATPGETPASALIVEDSASDLAPGQMRKSEFLSQLQVEVCRTVETAIAGTGRTTEDCPYLNHWFDFYERQDSAHIERAIHRYAPEVSSVTTASGYISVITQRARQSAEIWARTGEITGVPEGLSMGLPGMSLLGGIGRLISGIGGIFFKARAGGARKPDDPRAIQAQLGEGRPLDSGVRSTMESAFGMDFSHVRTHTDTTAAELSSSFNARAFTVGEHLAFGANEYTPGTFVGDALLAHELAHVVQQKGRGDSVAPMENVGAGCNALEKDADRSALHAVFSGWQNAVGATSNLARETMPRMRSGISLKRCSKDTRNACVCPTEINSDTTLTCDCENGIIVEADNITLDGGGNNLTGTGTSMGITLDGRRGVTVKNCRVTNFRNGIQLFNSSGNFFTENTATENERGGFDLRDSNTNTFTNNRAVNNTRDGFDVNDSNDNIFTENTANDNVLNGIELDDCNNNILTGNTANINDDGIDLNRSNENILTENTASNNRGDGFRINRNSINNNLAQNIANGNGDNGFQVGCNLDANCTPTDQMCDTNTFTENTANNNTDEDFNLISGTGNTCEGNTFTNPQVGSPCPPQFP